MDKLIPVFYEVVEAYSTKEHHNHGVTEWTLLVPAWTGRPPAYHVLRVFGMTGEIKLIGNELDLLWARAVARRPSERDGSAVAETELKEARKREASQLRTWGWLKRRKRG